MPVSASQMRRSSPFSLVSVVTLCLVSHRDGDFPHLTGLNPVQGGADIFYPRLDIRPSVGEQDYDSQAPATEVLLVPHALVGGYHYLVAFLLSAVQQIPVAQLGPPPLPGRIHGVFRKMAA